jgi:hypothetical protein
MRRFVLVLVVVLTFGTSFVEPHSAMAASQPVTVQCSAKGLVRFFMVNRPRGSVFVLQLNARLTCATTAGIPP